MNSNRLIPKKIMASTDTPSKQTIPNIIFQTFESNKVPESMYRAAMSWVENNPDYNYSFFDHEDRRSFIRTHFEEDVLHAFDQLKIGAFKADLWRYCVLYVHGGVYTDIDTICTYPLRKVIDKKDNFVSAFATIPGGIYNAFICSTPGHIFLKRTIEAAVKLIAIGTADHPLALTGPLCLGRAVNTALKRDRETRFVEGQHEVNGFSFKMLKKVHSPDPDKRTVAYKGQTILKCQYQGYEQDLAKTGQKYWLNSFPK